jgi:hypothetical protein
MPLILSGTNGISTNGSSHALSINSSGIVTKPNQPQFLVNLSAPQTGFTGGGSGVVLFNNAIYNVSGSFNTSTGRFTAPITGWYAFSASIYSTTHNQDQTWWSINGNRERSAGMTASTGGQSGGIFDVIRLTANDTIGIIPYFGSNSGVTIGSNVEHTYWRGILIG